jgi:aminoglycoside phosphotransferase (APT) family kinase protein
MAIDVDALLDNLRASFAPSIGLRRPVERMLGGFVTDVFSLEVEGQPTDWPNALVLRIFPPGTEPVAVRRERCAQDVVAAQGVPAPRVFASDEGTDVLGRPFMLMERMRGRPQMVIQFPQLLGQAPRLLSLPRRHAAAMAMVHALDASPLFDAFEAAGIDARSAGPDHWLDGAESSIETWELDRLRPALDWFRTNRPPEPARPSICHGDLFGANVLEESGRVTGIIDWNLVTIGDPAIDIGGQVAGYEMSAVPGPRAVQLGVMGFGKLLARGLRREYARYRDIPASSIRYYAAMRAFTEMTFQLDAERRIRMTGIAERLPTWRPEQCARYVFDRTGVDVEP